MNTPSHRAVPPMVSVITSTYNRSALLARAIRSVLQQGFQDWEMCIVGDSTPDDTEQVVDSFRDVVDERIRFHNLAEKSLLGSHGAIAKNYGIREMAHGEYIAYLDDDDRYLPDFLGSMCGHVRASAGASRYSLPLLSRQVSGSRGATHPGQPLSTLDARLFQKKIVTV